MDDGSGIEIGRREFLTVGSSCVLSLGVAGGNALLASPARAGLPAPPRLGFATGGVSGAAPSQPNTDPVIDARRLRLSDPELSRRGARVTLHGLLGSASDAARYVLSLYVHVRYLPHHRTPYRAWGFEAGEPGMLGAAVSLDVPVTAGSGLTLGLEVCVRGQELTTLVPLQLGREQDGGVALRRGTYLLAVSALAAGTTPRWSSCVVRNGEYGEHGLEVLDPRGRSVPCVAFSVDYPADQSGEGMG